MDDAQGEQPGGVAVAPRPADPQANLLTIIEAGAAGALGQDIYSDVKAACRAAAERVRDRLEGPDGEHVWMHQLIAEAAMGPCPPGRKLVHLNGNGLDNRRKNLAYVPESDARPAAPLNPRRPGRHRAR